MWLSRNVRKVSRGNINYSQEGENVLPMILLIHFLMCITHNRGIKCNNKHTVLQFWKWWYFLHMFYTVCDFWYATKMQNWFCGFRIMCFFLSYVMWCHGVWLNTQNGNLELFVSMLWINIYDIKSKPKKVICGFINSITNTQSYINS